MGKGSRFCLVLLVICFHGFAQSASPCRSQRAYRARAAMGRTMLAVGVLTTAISLLFLPITTQESYSRTPEGDEQMERDLRTKKATIGISIGGGVVSLCGLVVMTRASRLASRCMERMEVTE